MQHKQEQETIAVKMEYIFAPNRTVISDITFVLQM
jgi:hypothetical protein